MSMKNILPEEEGANLTIYDVLLFNGYDRNDPSNKRPDELFIIYRNEKGEKKVANIVDPAMEIYFVKPEYREEFVTPREYLEMDKCYAKKIPAKNVLNVVYDEIKKSNDPVSHRYKNIYQTAYQTGQFKSRKEILKWPYTLMSDMNVTEYTWVQLGYHYNLMHGHIIDKCFADIENDIYGLSSMEQAQNMDPVNACTLIFGFDKNGPNKNEPIHVYTYLLRNHKKYPQQADFENRLEEFYDECHRNFDKQTIIKKGKEKIVDLKAEYHIEVLDTEEMVLKAIFNTINKYKPDLCEFWNMPYDMPKMKARMEMLGLEAKDIMTDKDYFPPHARFVNYHMDNRPIDIAERNSYIRMSSTTQYIDQMQTYAGIRKGRKAYGSNKLDNIAKIELGMGKWTFPKGIDVTNACILDYWDFVLYNIRDVWCQYLIDMVSNDSMSIVYDMNQQNCPLYHLVKQTKYQKYIYYCWYLRKGVIPGNNVNTNYTEFASEEEQEKVSDIKKRQQIRQMLDKAGYDPDDIAAMMQEAGFVDDFEEDDVQKAESEDDNLDDIAAAEVNTAAEESLVIYDDTTDRKLYLPGGLVGDPNYNSANGTEMINGIRSKHIFDDVMDQDYASEYPWAKFTRSLSRSSQIGRLIIPHKISKYQNLLPLGKQKRKSDLKTYLPGAEFTADYISQDYLSFGAVWFNLPLVDEMNDLVDAELSKEDG